MKKILREPLLHFLLLGGAMFLLFQQVSNDTPPDDAEIVVTAGQIQALESGFKKAWQRAPEEKELNALIDNHIREEVLYREALALGLDKNDSIVRRRMSQKIKFLSEDIIDLEQPDDTVLQVYLDEHIDQYIQPSRFSFRQIYFNTSKRGQAAPTEIATLLAQLRKGEVNGSASGDPIMIRYQFKLKRETSIEAILGAQFVQALHDMPTGSWQGPVKSGFGQHLVYIDEFVASTAPVLGDIRRQVLRDWSAEKRAKTNRAIYAELRQRYHVTIESEKLTVKSGG